MKFKGIITALITPFHQGEVDYKSLIQLVQSQMDEGVDGFVINGTTGESPTLNPDEVSQIAERIRAEASGQIPLILGIGHNNTKKAIENAQTAGKLKMDAVLAVVPYYNKPSPEGLFQHFQTIARHSDLPVILYNVPSRTQAGLRTAEIKELSKEKQINGIKEASGDMRFAEELFSFGIKKDFCFLSGDDLSFLEFAKQGGHGVVSVASHFLLKPMKDALNQAFDQKNDPAFLKYSEILNLLYQVSNPMMIKQVLYFQKRILSPELRLPLCEPGPDLCEKMKSLLKSMELL